MNYLESFGVEVGKNKFHEEAIYGIALVYSALYNEISTCLDKHGLSPAKMNALMIIKHQGRDKGISQIEIGKRLMVTASNMTRLLDKLERDDLIARSSQEGDRRVNVIKITVKGAKLLDDIWPEYTGVIKKLAGHLSKEDQKSMANLSQQWLEHLV